MTSGLYEFNGVDFQLVDYKLDSTQKLPAINVTALVKDRTGKIWVGTWENGIFILDIKKERVHQIHMEAVGKVRLLDNRVKDLAMDGNGNIWVGYNNQGFSCIDAKATKIYSFQPSQYYSTLNSLSNLVFT